MTAIALMGHPGFMAPRFITPRRVITPPPVTIHRLVIIRRRLAITGLALVTVDLVLGTAAHGPVTVVVTGTVAAVQGTGRRPAQGLGPAGQVMVGMVAPVVDRAACRRADRLAATFARTATSVAAVTAARAVEIAKT